MPAKVLRRVNRTGPVSRVLVLPPDWCRGTGVDRGSWVEVRYGTLLLVVPPGKERDADRLIEAAGGLL